MQQISPFERKQIGVKRLAMVAGTPLDCKAGYQLLAKATAGEQTKLIEKYMHSKIDISLAVQTARIEARTTRRAVTTKKAKDEAADVMVALSDILKDGMKLSALCRTLADTGSQPGRAVFAARMFAAFSDTLTVRLAEAKCPLVQREPAARTEAALCLWLADAKDEPGAMAQMAQFFAALADNIVEVECSSTQRLRVATTIAELINDGLDPEAVADEADFDDNHESQWSFIARSRQGQRYRDPSMGARQDVETELKEYTDAQ
ncbi:hypothetical protein FNL56_21540 [Tardiphaga sp. vice304]|uniref:hypothetical protein n=1 Tax=Tardiphaga sp. vice304 TaxID=2592817 RepID=UPI00116290D1|nr:hypothetical protein [Tardiphaga sp. vice304]QDM28407.1 hypothetical protein FNL56_21540 [Tardiphaga sp. vice304]